jgi:hypothetical protein
MDRLRREEVVGPEGGRVKDDLKAAWAWPQKIKDSLASSAQAQPWSYTTLDQAISAVLKSAPKRSTLVETNSLIESLCQAVIPRTSPAADASATLLGAVVEFAVPMTHTILFPAMRLLRIVWTLKHIGTDGLDWVTPDTYKALILRTGLFNPTSGEWHPLVAKPNNDDLPVMPLIMRILPATNQGLSLVNYQRDMISFSMVWRGSEAQYQQFTAFIDFVLALMTTHFEARIMISRYQRIDQWSSDFVAALQSNYSTEARHTCRNDIRALDPERRFQNEVTTRWYAL